MLKGEKFDAFALISSYTNIFDSKQTYIWQEAKIRLIVSKDKFDRKQKSLEAYFRHQTQLANSLK